MRSPFAALVFLMAIVGACGKGVAAVAPDEHPQAKSDGRGAFGGPIPESEAVPDAAPKPVDASLVTTGKGPAVLARRAPDPAVPTCTKDERRRTLTFENTPVYTDKVDKDGMFAARLFVGNPATCTRTIAVPLSFTPPKTTATRTIDFIAYVPPGGAVVELRLSAGELAESNVSPGRYAITFGILDEDARPVGLALSGNPFRRGKDEVEIVTAPTIPRRIGISDELAVPFAINNVGDTANRITPLVVFTRPGDTAGIEYYEAPLLAPPGTSAFAVRISQKIRESKKIGPGSWLVTVTMFDGAGDRMNSFAGLPLTIGNIDLRLTRPELPTYLRSAAPLRVTFRFENHGDTYDKVTAVVAFTKPGTTSSKEFSFTREVPPGPSAFEAVLDTTRRKGQAVDKGVWLVTTAAFRSSGERIKSFTGHYLEITE